MTGCVIARDEEAHLSEVLPALRWADEVLVVVDAATQDHSVGVAESLADRVEVRPFESYAKQRNAALDLATSSWVFFVDADERVSDTLAAEVRSAAGSRPPGCEIPPVGYWVPRHNVIFGHTMRGAGWFPDYQLRLLDRTHARYDETRPVHEVVMLDGPEAWLATPLIHLNYQSLGQFIRKQRRYTAMEVSALIAAHAKPRRRALLGQPMREFWRRYVNLGGWRDGWVGLSLSGAMAYYAFERTRQARISASNPPTH